MTTERKAPRMTMYADLSVQDQDRLHETQRNKNRSALMIVDRKAYDLHTLTRHLSSLLADLLEDKIDTITIDCGCGRRTW